MHAATKTQAGAATDRAVDLSNIAVPSETHPYWLDLLQRSGLQPRPGLQGAGIAFIPPESKIDSAALLQLHHDGTILVGALSILSSLLDRGSWSQRIDGIEGEGPLFRGCSRIRMPVNAHTIGTELTHVDTAGPAPWIGLPLPNATDALGRAAAMHEFELAEGAKGAEIAEIVAGCDHGGLRRLVQNALRLALNLQGLPLPRLGPAPVGHSGCLGLRIDADDFDAEATRDVAAALQRSDLRATWFIDVERHEAKGGADAVRQLHRSGHEVQSHFYHHYTYGSTTRNRRNLTRSVEMLHRWGIAVHAAAAPFGTFNKGLQSALDARAMQWSSEFSAIYDDHPTSITGGPQVPIHPVCPILLLQSGHSEAATYAYFESLLQQRLATGEATVLYGHPIGDLSAVPQWFDRLRLVLDAHHQASGLPVWQANLSEIHEFFAARRHQSFTCRYQDGELRGRCDGVAGLITEDQLGIIQVQHGRFTQVWQRQQEPLIPSSSRPYTPGNRRQLRRRQRVIRFRRWLREVRKR